ncbi:hypothetical protein [Polaromonas sp.]|nr:hypothetical protein [Polaromonas sp.]
MPKRFHCNAAHIDGGYAEWLKQGAPAETMDERKAAKGREG